jgi:uncharacterized membrane protein YbhN (UPF0104 family)
MAAEIAPGRGGSAPVGVPASGAPLATAITGVAAYRALCFWLPLLSALASLPVLR